MAHIQGSKRAWHEDLDVMPRNPREYHNFTVGDQARVIAGDVHYNTVNHKDIILNSLHFPGMERYYHRPLESHPGTFDWLFDQRSQLHVCEMEGLGRPGKCASDQECNWVEADLRKHASKLQAWLETSDDIFWVQGKAGSGKSTFMKFLFEHQQTQAHLQRWAGGNVIAAAFFFWRAGSSELEKSYQGLLRGLLYQVLQERPELIELVLPQRWRAVLRTTTYKKPWTKSELVAAFDLLQASEINSRFCFFIDGLDEFDGDHRDLIDAIRSLSKSPFIKICVSSRPWGSFQREFGSDERLHVALHTLTKRDIDMYVATKLETAAQPASGVYCARGLTQLANAVRARSEGVFLWVALAIKDLRRGIEEQDSLSLLYDRLIGYPSELQDFIQRIFDGIDPAYKAFTGRLLLTMLEGTRPPALICLPFLEDSFTTDGEYIMDIRWSPRSETDFYGLIDRAAACANKWCRDLLRPVNVTSVKNEISSQFDWTPCAELPRPPTWCYYRISTGTHDIPSQLSFAHRSFHQFVEEQADIGTLSEMAGHSFDARLAWLFALLELSRCVPNLRDFVDVVKIAFEFLLDPYKHQWFLIAETDETLANGIRQCLEAFDLIGQNIERSPTNSHWTVHLLVNQNFSEEYGNVQLHGRLPAGNGCSSFISYLVCLAVPDFIVSPILTKQLVSLSETQKRFLLETSLRIPNLYVGTDANIFRKGRVNTCTLGHPTHHCDIVVQVITSGVDVNRSTQRIGCRNYSAWQFFLLWMHDYFHERPKFGEFHTGCNQPRKELELVEDTIEIFRTFLVCGADPFAIISSVDLIECRNRGSTIDMATFLSVADVLRDLRIVATSDLACFHDHHGWFGARLKVAGELEILLNEAIAQR